MSVFYCLKVEFGAIERGVIVNNVSIVGVVGIGGMVFYVVAKYRVVGFMRVVVFEYANCGVRVNAFVIGNVDMLLYCGLVGVGLDDLIFVLNLIGCVVLLDEVVVFVVFLFSDEVLFVIGVDDFL